jgi:predicted TIM-barrel fold metal-dependent hydrolase
LLTRAGWRQGSLPDRCTLGRDLPIERLRSGFERLYRAYDEIFAERAPGDRQPPLRETAERSYGTNKAA